MFRQLSISAPGFQYIKFHIQGSELERTYTRSALEDLRTKAAKIMCISPENISIPGIERSDSLLITLMVADNFVGLMQNALKNKTRRADLANLGVDNVRIHDRTWGIEGKTNTSIYCIYTATDISKVSFNSLCTFRL